MTKHVMTENDHLYIYSMGKRLRVIAIFSDDDAANAYMARHDRAAVIATHGPFVFLADKYDYGTPSR